MEQAYVYKTKEGNEIVIIATNEEIARKEISDMNAVFEVEPVKAYNTPSKNGIVVATSINQIRHKQKVNTEYWDAIDGIIEKHVSACIAELKQWSVTDMVFDEDFEEENVIFEISKKVGEVLIDTLEDWGNAEFPLYDGEEE